MADGRYLVRGGVGGTRFQWEELEGLRSRLSAVAAPLGELAAELGRIRNAVEDLSCPGCRVTASASSESRRCQLLVLDCWNTVATLGWQLDEGILRYRAAEAAATTLLSLLEFPRPVVWAAELIGALVPPRPVVALPAPITETGTGSEAVQLTGGIASLLERTYPADSSTIEVLLLDNGTAAVLLPGTQLAGRTGLEGAAFGLDGIAEALGHNSRFVAAAAAQALRSAGAAPGTPVVLAGYSQGGMHAVNLASDPAFTGEYDVRYVLTAGAPVGREDGSSPVRKLHLRHLQDWVPRSEGVPDPDTRNSVSVTFVDAVILPEGDGPGLGPGHNFSNYVASARLLDGSTDPSVRESAAYLAALLGSGRAVRHAYRLHRMPAPERGGRKSSAPETEPARARPTSGG